MSDLFDLAVIGAGAAGMMCAAQAGQRGRRVLLVSTDPASNLAGSLDDVESGDPRRPARGFEKGGQHADQRRFPRAVGADQGHQLPAPDGEGDAGDGLHPAAMGQSLTPLDEYARALLRQQTDSQPEAWTLQTSWWGGKPWRIQVQADANGQTTLLNVAPTPNESSAD